MQSRSCIRFAPRVKEIDRWYEQNFCADFDNGVIHDLVKEEENKKNVTEKSQDSLVSSFDNKSFCSDEAEEEKRIKEQNEKKKKKKQTELEKIESLIQQQDEAE